MKINQTNFINVFGIGTFAFLSVQELSIFINSVLRHFFILFKPDNAISLWLPEVVSLIVFTLTLLLVILVLEKRTKINSGKTLIIFIVVFFGIRTVHLIYSFSMTIIIRELFPDAFHTFYMLQGKNFHLMDYMAHITTLKYIIFGITMLAKRKNMA